MLEIAEAFNNCGQLHLKLHRTDSEAQFVHEIEKVVDEGKMYIKVCSDGITNYGYWVNGKWWSGNAKAINHRLELIGTEWELEEGVVFSLDGYACGLTKRAFNRLTDGCDFSNLSTKEVVELLNSSLEKGNGDIMGETREMVAFGANDSKRGKEIEPVGAKKTHVSASKDTSGRVSFGEKFLKDFGLDVLENGELLQLVILDLLAECMVEIHKLAGNRFSDMSEDEVREFCLPMMGNTEFTTQIMSCMGYWYNDIEAAAIEELIRLDINSPLANPEFLRSNLSSSQKLSDLIYAWIKQETGIDVNAR